MSSMVSRQQQGHVETVRRRSAWLVALPLLVVGSLAAHQLAYLFVAGDQAGALLAETGHGYLDQLPTGGLLGLTCLVLGLSLAGVDRLRGAVDKAIPAWGVATIPLLGFALQEHGERYAATGHVPWAAAFDPTFLVGLALQLPFAGLAYLAARLLLRTVATLVAELAAATPRSGRHPRLRPIALGTLVISAAGLARCLAPRGPPYLRIV